MSLPGHSFHCQPDRFHHSIQVATDLIVGKPQESDTERLDKKLSPLVIMACGAMKVRFTVYLYRQLQERTVEVEYIRTHAVLSAKLETEQLLSAQP